MHTDRSIEQEQADQVRRTVGATLAARALEEVLPAIGKGYGPNMHRKVAQKMSENMETRYEIRADNPDPAKAEEWAVFAIAPNCHARRVAYTTDKAEADAVLLGLRAAPDLYAACEMVLDAATEDGHELSDSEICSAIDWDMLRAALATARGEGRVE